MEAQKHQGGINLFEILDIVDKIYIVVRGIPSKNYIGKNLNVQELLFWCVILKSGVCSVT